ncbi:malto-oligosyltrehalose trehalohydrolase [Methylosarcina fibrata]|uniref:malto-oligosyltrehalose trehalohydrolase n=1 Tax=Methylosarcina fibrata TaxID=105972 RepID=UPI0003750838|nr:malto-oligosyltrehalose trehalohydrolase [Methylosarcina fibrata]
MTDVHSCHPMPFGTRILDDGRVNFRLWAPGAQRVELCLQGAAPEFRLHMAAEDDGWFGITTELASSGFYYQYLINGTHYVPDPASRYQPWDVHGSSQVVDPSAYRWQDHGWQAGPWEDTVIYELHVGAFSPEGTFAGVKNRLDHLVDLGVTAIQLMPVAEFAGQRNWGYDGVLPFAPDSSYGTPDDLKDLIAAAHGKGLMVFNDVVYNHFGPEGNYLRQYAPNFFTHRFLTPWGDAFNFSGSRWVRQYFIHNALYWLEEYHFDGLRLDAVHAIFDDNSPGILEELAETVRQWPGFDRQVYLMLENDNNAPQYLRHDPAHPRRFFDAQWNDDLHHALHVLLTGETFGYYRDYGQQPMRHLGRCLTEGFAYQGEKSAYRQGRPRGKPSSDLPPTAFISFLQNHDMVGNRPLGERITDLSIPEAVRAATALLLLAPFPPLLFMGQEWACSSPFPYFVDFPEELAEQVAAGRRREFSGFPAFADDEVLSQMPLPGAPQTFQSAKLFWEEIELPHHRHWLEFHRELLRIRKREIIPRIGNLGGGQAGFRLLGDRAIHVRWRLNDGSVLLLNANLGREPISLDHPPEGQILYASAGDLQDEFRLGRLSPWSVLIYLEEPQS